VVYGSGLGSFGRDLVFVQDAAEMDDFGGRQIKEFFLLQAAKYFNDKELLSFLCRFGGTKELQEQLLCRYLYLKFFVGLRQNSLLRALKPVAFASLYFMHGLGIQLVVVDLLAVTDGTCKADTDEPPATRSVGKHIVMVTGGDKRGIPAQRFHRSGKTRFCGNERNFL